MTNQKTGWAAGWAARWTATICKANGIDLHYLRTGGQKPPLVLLHGLTGSGACWRPLARALEAEFDVVMPDARGHGGMTAAVVAAVLAATMASQIASPIRGVILADPTFLSPQHQQEVYESDAAEQHRRLLSLNKDDVLAQARVRHAHRRPEFVELATEARLKTRIAAFEVLTPPNPEYRRLISAIETPTLLVIADNGVVSLETAQELQQRNPRLHVEQIQDAGHALQYDQPDRFEATVKTFLRSCI